MVRWTKREDWELLTALDSLRKSRVVRFRNLEYWEGDGWVENGYPIDPSLVESEFQKVVGSILVSGVRHKVYIQPASTHLADPVRQSFREFLGEPDE